YKILFAVEQIYVRDLSGVWNVQCLASEEFVQKPDAPHYRTGRSRPDICRDLFLGQRLKDALQYKKIEIFMAQGEYQMGMDCIFYGIFAVEYSPLAGFFYYLLQALRRDTGRLANRCFNVQRLDQR